MIPEDKDAKFGTNYEAFEKDYAEKAFLQKGFNGMIIANLVRSIFQWFPKARTQPLTIVDLCCGDGGSTNELLMELDKAKVKVKQIVGYDNSKEQIDRAKEYKDPRLLFMVQDVEKMTDWNKFDLAISLFGLHWMENIQDSARRIHYSLKPTGKLLFFLPIDRGGDLHKVRTDFMLSAKWKHFFENYKLRQFISDERIYIQIFDKFFDHDNKTRTLDDPRTEPEEKFALSLSSWMQEVRHMKTKGATDEQRSQYVQELAKTVPEIPHPNEHTYLNRFKKENETYILSIARYLHYQGPRKEHRILKDLYFAVGFGLTGIAFLYSGRNEAFSKLSLMGGSMLTFAAYLAYNKAERKVEQIFNSIFQFFESIMGECTNSTNTPRTMLRPT